MNVKKSDNYQVPAYPSKRELIQYGLIISTATMGLAALSIGCRTHREPTDPPRFEGHATAGIPQYEPVRECELPTQSYVVQEGDTLYGLAKRFLGDGNQWHKIVLTNPGLTPQNLKARQTITLP